MDPLIQTTIATFIYYMIAGGLERAPGNPYYISTLKPLKEREKHVYEFLTENHHLSGNILQYNLVLINDVSIDKVLPLFDSYKASAALSEFFSHYLKVKFPSIIGGDWELFSSRRSSISDRNSYGRNCLYFVLLDLYLEKSYAFKHVRSLIHRFYGSCIIKRILNRLLIEFHFNKEKKPTLETLNMISNQYNVKVEHSRTLDNKRKFMKRLARKKKLSK